MIYSTRVSIERSRCARYRVRVCKVDTRAAQQLDGSWLLDQDKLALCALFTDVLLQPDAPQPLAHLRY